jgi:hypothetical protein
MLRTAPPQEVLWDSVLLRPPCVPLEYSVEHFPYAARRRWHIDVAQFNTTVESIDDSVDDRRRGADGAGLTCTLDAQWVGRRRHVMS